MTCWPGIVFAALTCTLLDVDEFGRVAHVAGVPASPVHVGAFAALPVLGAEQSPGLVGRRLADLDAELLLGRRV